jgi:transcriptional regulator with XRE-family HTH domain
VSDGPSLNPEGSLWDWLADELRYQRLKAGLTQDQLGRIIGAKKATVSNIENRQPRWHLNEDHVAKLDEYFGLNHLFTRLLGYAKEGNDSEWFQQWLIYAERAVSIRMYEALVVPGLLQTPDYARGLLEAGGVLVDVGKALKARMERKELLNRPKPPRLWVTLHENAIDQLVASPDVMREQFQALLEVPRHVVVRVVPRSAGAHPGLDGSFFITTTDSEEVAYFEACGVSRLEKGKPQVQTFIERMEDINSVALPGQGSAKLISQRLEGYW